MVESPCGPSAPNQGSALARGATKKPDTRQAHQLRLLGSLPYALTVRSSS
jgi:hypothetical protein